LRKKGVRLIFAVIVAMLIERKEKELPDIREYMMDHQVIFSGNSFTLNVAAAPNKGRKF